MNAFVEKEVGNDIETGQPPWGVISAPGTPHPQLQSLETQRSSSTLCIARCLGVQTHTQATPPLSTPPLPHPAPFCA